MDVWPISSNLRGATCEQCGQYKAKWRTDMLTTRNALVCSFCFLYASRWAVENVFSVEALIRNVEQNAGPFQRLAVGRLKRGLDADLVVKRIIGLE